MKSRKKAVILGGGLAGLSCAYHLDPKRFEHAVIEKSGSVGGTARSVTRDGFTFDFTGHLLHLHSDYTRNLITRLLKGNLVRCRRRAAIHSQGVLTPYPFQVHTYGLPKRVVRECVEGFREAVRRFSDPALRITSQPFRDWSRRTFGDGIHRHFMKPYNEKLWQTDLKEMTAEWCGMFVPQPGLEDVVRGARSRPTRSWGYNTHFIYPRRGGIQVLPEALARGLNVRLGTSVEEVDWRSRKARLSSGEWLDYDHLVSSAPLPELLKRMKGLHKDLEALAGRLRWTSVLCVNLGVDRPKISDKSWIYFPEKKYRFYRVGFPMNFTPHAVPKGTSSMYVEVSYRPGSPPDWKDPGFLKRIRRDLETAGILRKSDRFLTSDFIPIRYAYVVYTPDRKALTGRIFDFLESVGIFSIGRYGEWKYSFMEEAILDGKKAAESIEQGGL